MPRVRKAPTVRQQIEATAKKAEVKPGSGQRWLSIWVPLKAGWRILKAILRPLSPIGKVLAKVLGWLTPRYFINSWRELRQVTWPTRRETWRLTGAVLIFALVFGGLVAVIDKGLDELFKKVILK